ncbi:hypothetical protein [Gilvimarinus agarilyticus]|uniref:hypothetical protein n=1 Tax=Gilvimarinus agarilyticus TaxID=679259 RepID=UPI0005A11E73|nr:hypothetical protein [Gilvimarinus agarilyticus]
MAEDWALRQRRSNRLARKLAGYLFELDDVTPIQIYGLSKLSWITTSFEGENASYISSTKIPALENIFNCSFQNLSHGEVYKKIGTIIDDDTVAELAEGHTGFTNFYKAYRNSVLDWVGGNFNDLLPLYKAAYRAENSADRKDIVKSISALPGVPKANHPESLMRPEFFLTPAFFMLDADIKFPLINGNDGVKSLLKRLEVENSDLITQYTSMTSLYGVGGIVDAADLDQVGHDLPDFIDTDKRKAKKSLLLEKETNGESELPLKDEGDVEAIRRSAKIKQRRIHNHLTNKLKSFLSSYTLLEGCDQSCMFDALVRNYSEDEDLLIEVKSSTETPHVRMAVGQLFNYWYELKGNAEPNIAILLPEKPDQSNISFLGWMEVGLMWFENDQLCTVNDWLKHLTNKN